MMSPAAGVAAPAQSAAAAVAPAIAGQEPDPAAASRDPQGPAEGADPANAAARKTVWGVPAPSPAAAAAAANPVIAGDASWPALVESKRGSSKSASFDSLKSLSDGSGPSLQDSIAASVPPQPVVETKPISTGSNPTATVPPNVVTSASSQQNGSTNQPNPVRRTGSNGGNNGGNRGNGSSASRRAASNCGSGGSSGSGGDDNWNGRSLGNGSGCNSSNGDGGSNLNDNHPGSGSGDDRNRNALGNNSWNNNIRGVGSRSINGNGDGNNRNSGGSSNHWNNNSRNSNGTTNGGGGRGYRGRRDHERGGSFSPRNYPRASGMPYHQQQQQQPGVYQPGPFQRPPPPPAAHFMVPQPFMLYAPPFAYHGDAQHYPFYLPPVEQFQNMHLVRPQMQPAWVPQDQLNLQEDIRTQVEFYFSTNNLCHDTFLRRHMNDQGWVSIDLILTFNRMRAFTGLVDTNYILDAIRGSENLEVQGNNVRKRNDWADWLLH